METLINPLELLIQINDKLDRIEENLKRFDASEYFEKSKIMNTKETCELMHISMRTLQNYRDKRLIKFTQVGRKITYGMPNVLQFMDDCGITTHMKQSKVITR
jgi:hypothetical protein